MKFNEIVKKIRTERKISQPKIAEEIGVTTRQYQRYEYGENEPPLSVLIALADYFDVSLDYLVGRSEIKERR